MGTSPWRTAYAPSAPAVGHFFFFGNPIAAPHFAYPRSFLPSGFLLASAEDMAHYLVAHTNGGRVGSQSVLSPTGIATLHRPAILMSEGRPASYGMGWVTRTMNDVPIMWHNGDTGHFHSEMVLVPEGNWGFVLLANGSHPSTAMYYQEIAAGVASILAGKTVRDDGRIHRTVGIVYYVVLTIAFCSWRGW